VTLRADLNAHAMDLDAQAARLAAQDEQLIALQAAADLAQPVLDRCAALQAYRWAARAGTRSCSRSAEGVRRCPRRSRTPASAR